MVSAAEPSGLSARFPKVEFVSAVLLESAEADVAVIVSAIATAMVVVCKKARCRMLHSNVAALRTICATAIFFQSSAQAMIVI
jgi:hypothetical protein